MLKNIAANVTNVGDIDVSGAIDGVVFVPGEYTTIVMVYDAVLRVNCVYAR